MITNTVDGIELHIDGAGPRALVMVHGWPDTWRLWDAQVPHFAARGFRCVRFTLPGFDRSQPRQGHSPEDLVRFIAKVVDAVSPQAPVVLMLHDWGCVVGYAYALRHAARVAAVVGVDIGDAQTPTWKRGLTRRERVMVAGYQLWLALAWRVAGWGAGWLANRMTLRMAQMLGCRSEPKHIGACMNYLYDVSWTGSHGGWRGVTLLDTADPPWPLFYAYGTAKPLMFHSRGWLQGIQAQPRHRVMAFDCGHWVMRSRAEAFNAAVGGWLDGDPR